MHLVSFYYSQKTKSALFLANRRFQCHRFWVEAVTISDCIVIMALMPCLL